ncbi:spermidine/putrescine ABC transporter permease [Microbacterium laevaniformans]|uniref:Spermidine/putrescine ABC transporter permease n=2 Tax=Microbacterium laevaniformans TaxID=36807 RepID=A0A4S2DBH0_9MICO|nr:spermidine/putrescine ABC transporter permease [Microbacterium laevaniformans]
MQSMDAATREEFATLRRRAYGPDADIADDPAALARLRELEQRQGRGSAAEQSARMAEAERLFGPPVPRPENAVPETPAPAGDAAAVGVAEPHGAGQHYRSSPTPPPIGRALLIGWAASIVVVAIVVGALVFALASLRPVSAVTGARQVASLDQPTADVPMVLPWARNGDRGTTYSFAGLLIVVSSGENRGFEGECVTVLKDVPDVAGSQIGNSACSASPFHPAVSIHVDRGSSEELTAAFPVGTVLQFEWDGTAVGVFAADPPAPTSAPA